MTFSKTLERGILTSKTKFSGIFFQAHFQGQSSKLTFEYFPQPKETRTLNNASNHTTCQLAWHQNNILEIQSPQPH